MSRVYIMRAINPVVPGEHFKVHATMAGARASALVSLNLLRDDLGMRRVKRFTEKSVTACKNVTERQGDDPDDCDVWIGAWELHP